MSLELLQERTQAEARLADLGVDTWSAGTGFGGWDIDAEATHPRHGTVNVRLVYSGEDYHAILSHNDGLITERAFFTLDGAVGFIARELKEEAAA